MTKPTIITNGIVLTCDPTDRCGQYSIFVKDGRIREISDSFESLVRENPDAEVIDATGKLIVPGFVNAHHHGESFLLHEATRALHFSLWKADARLTQLLDKFLHASSHDDITSLYRAVYTAHLKSGTTCVGEFPLSFDDDGFKTMLGGIASCEVTAIVALQNWDQIRHVKAAGMPRVHGVVNLGESEGMTVYSFEHLSKAAKEMKVPLLAHIAETNEEVEAVRNNFQRGCISLLNSFNTLRANTVLIHANHITEDEVLMIKNVSGTVVVCPRSTAMKQTGYPSLRHLAKHNVRLCLGTDWGSTDMLEEMRFIYQLPLLIPGLRTFSPAEVLRMGTINGAYALGVSHEIGSIEVGKRADLSFFNYANIRMPVVHSDSSTDEWSRLLIEHSSTLNITDVMIRGEIQYGNRELVAMTEGEIVNQFKTLHDKFFPSPASSVTRVPPVASKSNVLPFVPERAQGESEGFEQGFSPLAKTATILDISDRTVEVNAPEPKPARDPVKPELPKNIRRVFGEEEDY